MHLFDWTREIMPRIEPNPAKMLSFIYAKTEWGDISVTRLGSPISHYTFNFLYVWKLNMYKYSTQSMHEYVLKLFQCGYCTLYSCDLLCKVMFFFFGFIRRLSILVTISYSHGIFMDLMTRFLYDNKQKYVWVLRDVDSFFSSKCIRI